MVKRRVRQFENMLRNPQTPQWRVRESTIKTYVSDVERLVEFCKTDNPTESKIQEYLTYLSNNGVGPRSIAKYIASFRKYCLLVLQRELSIVAPEYPEPLPAWFSIKEIQKLFDSYENLRDECICRLGYFCALRVHEVRLVDREHVDLSNGLLRVYGKGKRQQVSIPLNSNITRRKLRSIFEENNLTTGAIFTTHHGRICLDRLEKTFHKALDKTKIKKEGATFHSLRHSRITHLLMEGWNLYELKEFARHKNINTTVRYLHIYPQHLMKKTESIGKDF